MDNTEDKTSICTNEEKELFKNMFQKHSAVMLLINPDTGAIIDSNDSACKFYGYDKATLNSMNISDINILSRDEIKLKMENAEERTENFFEFPHKLANKEIRTVEVYSSPITYHDKTILFSIIHDITKRKEEEKIIQEKMNEIEKMNKLMISRELEMVKIKEEMKKNSDENS